MLASVCMCVFLYIMLISQPCLDHLSLRYHWDLISNGTPYYGFHTISHNHSCNVMQFSQSSTQFWIFQQFLAQFQHVGYHNACTQIRKFNRNTFKHFLALPHAISCNCIQFLCYFMQFWLFQPFLSQFQYVWYQNTCTQA